MPQALKTALFTLISALIFPLVTTPAHADSLFDQLTQIIIQLKRASDAPLDVSDVIGRLNPTIRSSAVLVYRSRSQ